MVISIIDYFNNIIVEYSGNGLFVLVGIVCILLTFLEKNKKNGCSQIIFVLFIVLFNPVSIWICKCYLFHDDGRVVKVLMAIPFFVAISYIIVKYIKKENQFWLCVFLICIFGANILSDKNYQKATNLYKLDQKVIDVCDFIEETEDDYNGFINCLVDDTLAAYVRQYNPRIVLNLGRWDYYIDDDNPASPLYQMRTSVVDSQLLTNYAYMWNIEYIVLPSDRIFTEDLENYGYLLLAEVSDYYIFQKTAIHNTHESSN